MPAISLRRIDPGDPRDREDLIAFLTANDFPFHVRTRMTREQVEEGVTSGSYRSDDNDSYWIELDASPRVGFLRFQDLSDGGPTFDLRLATAWRGKGLASSIVDAAADHVFTTMPEVIRFEAQTREDNVAMRRALLRCGWVKEAHYREAWPVERGPALASVAYAIIRRDWESGETTPVPWDDEPHRMQRSRDSVQSCATTSTSPMMTSVSAR